jgi:hypothetical protein
MADTASYDSSFAITPSDTNDVEFRCDAIMVGTAGDVAFIPISQAATNEAIANQSARLIPQILKAVQPGQIIRAPIRRVMSTGTTATNIRGLGESKIAPGHT